MNALRSLLLAGLVAVGCGGVVEDSSDNARGLLGLAGHDQGSAGNPAERPAVVSGALPDAPDGAGGSASAPPHPTPHDPTSPGGSTGTSPGGSTGTSPGGSTGTSPGTGGAPSTGSPGWGGGCGAGSFPGAGAGPGGSGAGSSAGTAGSVPGEDLCTYDASALLDYPPGGDPYANGGCPCTRRDPGNAPQCPKGDGVSYSAVVGPEGGTLEFPQITYAGVPFRLKFPPGAVATSTAISVTASGAPTAEFQDYSPLIHLSPADLVFAQPVAVDLGVELPHGSGYVHPSLAIQISAGASGCFHPVSKAYINAGFVQGEIASFGVLFAGHLKPATVAACP